MRRATSPKIAFPAAGILQGITCFVVTQRKDRRNDIKKLSSARLVSRMQYQLTPVAFE
jgi:hypothetical protein